MKKMYMMMAVLSLFLLSSCMTTASRGQMGGVGGAAAGAIAGQAIGRDTQSTLLGAAIGGMLGYVIGNEMDKYDQAQLSRVYENAPSGQATSWVNPDNQNHFQVVPQPAYQGAGNRWCRQAEVIATIDGRRERTQTTACRDMNGVWQLQ